MAINFDEIDSEMLIEEIKNYPELWNQSHENYHDRLKKREAWTNVCQVFSEGFEEKDDQEKNQICNKIVRKWRNLRDAFIRALKTKAKAQSTRQYIYGKQLSFLLTAGIEIENQSNLEDTTEEDSEKSNDHMEQKQKEGAKQLQTTHNENSSRKRKRDIKASSPDFRKSPASSPVVASTAESNPDRSFFDSIIPSIKDFTEDQKLELRCEILNIIKRMRNPPCSQNNGYSLRTHRHAYISCPPYPVPHPSNYIPQHEFNRSFPHPKPRSSRHFPDVHSPQIYPQGPSIPISSIYLPKNESQPSHYSIHDLKQETPPASSPNCMDIHSNSDDENLDLFNSSDLNE